VTSSSSIWVELFATLGFAKGLLLLAVCFGFAEIRRRRAARARQASAITVMTTVFRHGRALLHDLERLLRRKEP